MLYSRWSVISVLEHELTESLCPRKYFNGVPQVCSKENQQTLFLLISFSNIQLIMSIVVYLATHCVIEFART